MRMRFSGTRALIIGGSCELGLTLAGMLISQDVMPVLTYRNENGRRRIVDGLSGAKGPYESLMLDLSSDHPCEALPGALENGVDYLVDFAHESLEALMASVDAAVPSQYLQANIGARCEVVRQVTRKMLASRKGRMVYISSTAAQRPNPGQGFYAAAKQAGEAFYRSVGLELACRGITTVTLRPGYVDTGRGRRYAQDEPTVVRGRVPLGRLLRAEEIAETIMFLLSESADGINATVVTMDGGLTAGK